MVCVCVGGGGGGCWNQANKVYAPTPLADINKSFRSFIICVQASFVVPIKRMINI